jgi:hypothetical protein
LFKIKENKGLRGDVLEYVAQARPQFDKDIGQKDHFRMETNSRSGSGSHIRLFLIRHLHRVIAVRHPAVRAMLEAYNTNLNP